MRGKKIPAEKAVQAYYVYIIRLKELISLVAAWKHFSEHKGRMAVSGEGVSVEVDHSQIANTLLLAILGWSASLVDKDVAGLNVFDVLLVLFPRKKQEIEGAWEKISPTMKLLHEFRNEVAFHGGMSLERQQKLRAQITSQIALVFKSVQSIMALSQSLGTNPYEGLLSSVSPQLMETHNRIMTSLATGIYVTDSELEKSGQ